VLGGRSARAVELRRLAVEATPAGATVQLVFSGPAPVTVRRADATADAFARLYVDLPRGTRLAGGIQGLATAPAPIAALRVGLGESGALRVVVDVAQGARWDVQRRGRTASLVLSSSDPPVARREEAPPAVVTPPPVPGPHPKIVLDPGHGGSDPGAEGFAVEKAVTLDIARQLATLLRERVQADVVLTRAADATLALAARTARANAEGADLFVSIHANASRSRRLHGVETYVLDNTTDHATMRLAAMENGLDLITPRRDRADLRYILSDLVQVGKMEESAALATAVQHALVRHLAVRYRGIADLGVKRGPFYVLVGAYMPCVLVETSFLTHPAEGRRLAGREYRAAVAEGIYAGIARFLADTRRARTL